MGDFLIRDAALVGGLLFAAAMLIAAPPILGILRRSNKDERVNRRLASPTAGTGHADGLDEAPSVGKLARAAASLAERAMPTNEAQLSKIRFKLVRAGFTQKNAVALFFGVRLVCLIVPQIALLFALEPIARANLPDWFPAIASVFLAVAGFYAPTIIVDRRIEKKVRECSNGFPDMMDLLVACVEAGLSLDAAVLRVSEEMALRHPELSLNLKTLALEMRAGRSRKAAWRAFADRIGLEEAGSLATMLRQAEEMGTSLGETLRIFSRDMRQRRILMAEEKAMALPAKMTVPLIVFVFPVLLGVLVLPAIIRFQIIGY